MYTRKRYRAIEMALWTRFDTLKFILIITAWVAAYQFIDIAWLRIPWTPMALIGTAVAFVIGFQNNSVYGRIWEARKIWGGVVNTSRTFAVFVQDMVTGEHAQKAPAADELAQEVKTLTYRHIAWMTALRHSMRQEKEWEVVAKTRTNTEWGIAPPEKRADLKEDLSPYLSEQDLEYVLDKGNKQTAVLYLQSHHLRALKERGLIWQFAFLQLERVIEELFTLQGKTERIKNFPYPRQYATLNHFFMWILLLFLPIALVPQFTDIGVKIISDYPRLGEYFAWLSIPIYTAVAWVFHTMERIGRTGENPFEGTANDVPISTIARGIETDLRQNLGEKKEDIPPAFADDHHVQF